MVSEWRHRLDVEWHLDSTDAMVRHSMDMLRGSRRALDELQQVKATTRERLAASWALLTKHANAVAKKSTAPENPTLPPSSQPHSRP